MDSSKRKFLVLSGLTVASTLYGSNNKNTPKDPASPNVKAGTKSNKAPLPDTSKPRVLVLGGGWSGLSIAKTITTFAPDADVILVERRQEFISCPVSNLWLVDKVDLEYITHDYLQAARNYNYTFFNATAIGLDKKNRILKTSEGDIGFDYLVLSPGIDYDYSRWTTDTALITRLKQEYPAGFIPGSEHITLKNKIHNFKEGNFILTVPGGNYRCLPAPYERACLIADYFKQKKLKAKVIILDENNAITIKKKGFSSAFEELYRDYIEYIPNAALTSIDLDKKIVTTEMDEFEFADAAFYPRVRGAKIIETMGFAKDAKDMMEGNINPLTYEVEGEKNIFIAGDARPMGFSKSGNTSNTEGKYVGRLIAQRINKGKAPKWESPITLCFSAVSTKPENAIFIYTKYAFDKKDKSIKNAKFIDWKLFSFTETMSSENWKKDGSKDAASIYSWSSALYFDMFGPK
ncbi:FAD/NAD(P)-binding oxidoreductase [Sulfurovum riftiae]|uniref:Twin-arginine translocation pathway signal protein n=1 Tax=Sulfurovum riftiae TaxID=1630136 RepID=A0A151CI69_9BACT|nr:FAD/NAD(P)-binding oxidoreductase [Sulfurovum riftiae]KYJ87134.1 twin-arginine translocation pathway signal protein [Sulfurovum riftiae]